ncbi:MAG TPA: FAD-dependent oxidoreductase, partial [Rugosimonospora sp.]|nr:FAD-dependent oxidoreductase [Rugosimonospora sp.]
KPWDPPEEKLYPVVDALIEAWQASGEKEVPEAKLVGHRWSAPSYEIRDFLARNAVPYRWYSADEPEGERLLEAAGVGPEGVPLVITAEGRALPAPSTAEVATAVGLSTDPAADFYDLIIIGGGPAGLGAAVYGASEGLRTVLVERLATGGQAGQSSRIENYLGFPDGVSGDQLTERARRQATKFGTEILTARNVVALERRGSARVVRFADGGEIAAHAVLLATGVSYRPLAAPGCDDFTGRGVYYGSAATQGPDCAGEDVYIVGGANSAGQAAVFFSRHARSVTLVIRGDGLERSMSHYLIQQLRDIPNVSVRANAEVVAASGDGHLESITVRDNESGKCETLETGHLFIFIGAEPCTDWLGGEIFCDPQGFLCTGPDLVVDGVRPRPWDLDREPYYLETSLPGVFAAGDARSTSVKRVASAVGEGAMAVTLIHRYLEAQ